MDKSKTHLFIAPESVDSFIAKYANNKNFLGSKVAYISDCEFFNNVGTISILSNHNIDEGRFVSIICIENTYEINTHDSMSLRFRLVSKTVNLLEKFTTDNV